MAALVRRYRRTRALPLVIALATLLVALFALTPTGAASSARAAENSARFTDSTGEDPQGPDISTGVLATANVVTCGVAAHNAIVLQKLPPKETTKAPDVP